MITLIAHRGNTEGSKPDQENRPEYIQKALDEGYDVEVDVWYEEGLDEFALGHDEPQYKTTKEFLRNKKLWCHAKDILTFHYLLKDTNIHCFFHQKDDVILTSLKFLWLYPNIEYASQRSVLVMPNTKQALKLKGWYQNNFYGICSDEVALLRQNGMI